jgi:hypothetical protein
MKKARNLAFFSKISYFFLDFYKEILYIIYSLKKKLFQERKIKMAKYKVTVFKIIGRGEIEVEAKNEKEAKKRALIRVHNEKIFQDLKGTINYIAIIKGEKE